MTAKIKTDKEAVYLYSLSANRELQERVYRAHFKAIADQQGSPMQPNQHESCVLEYDGRRYVVLRSGTYILGVYRWSDNDTLRRDNNPPTAILDFGD